METTVLYTDNGDGSAEFTITFADEDHRFSVLSDNNHAVVSYEETLSWRGKIRVNEPDEDVFKALVQSDEMTTFLNKYDLDRVSRDRR